MNGARERRAPRLSPFFFSFSCSFSPKIMPNNSIGGSKGDARDTPPPRGPNSFILMQFSTKKLQNNRLVHPLWKLAPPLENLGSGTE